MQQRKKCPADIQKELEAAFSSSSSFQSFLKRLSKESSDDTLHRYYRLYSESNDKLYKDVHEAVFKFVQQPLFIAFFSWANEMQISDPSLENYAYILINEGFLSLLDNDGIIYTIASAKHFDHKEILNKIRSRRELSLAVRERLVDAYLSFTRYLETETFDYVCRAFDPDEVKRQGRAIHYSMFIKFLEHLDEKGQLIAKLLYFGGSRTLDDILSLDLKDVDFQNLAIRFGSQHISYPAHIFSDISALAQNRVSGRLFFGRQNAPLNPATIFRNFKEAGSRVGLGDSFSPKSLTTSM